MPEIAELVAQTLLTIRAVGFAPYAPITFKSGIVSPVYVDNRILPFYPDSWRTVISGFAHCIQQENIGHDIIAGVAVGGIPHSAALAYEMGTPFVFIRKETKEHGKQKRIEGGEVAGRTVLLIEDLITTGGSSLNAAQALREAEAQVNDVLAIVSYGFRAAHIAFQTAKINLHTLTNFEAILGIAKEQGYFKTDELDIILDWFNDPHGWAGRHGHL